VNTFYFPFPLDKGILLCYDVGMSNKQIDWKSKEEQAQRMTIASILFALNDINKTLPYADENDRIDGGNRGGYYRDEASVLRAELKKRGVK